MESKRQQVSVNLKGFGSEYLMMEEFSLQEISIKGISIAGVSTCILIPELNICFDVAQGLPFSISADHYFITHGHMDHAAGIPYLISQRALNHLPPSHFYMPQCMIEPLTQIMNAWESLEGFKYDYHFYGLKLGDQIEISQSWKIQTFQTLHRVESLGYTLVKKNKKLKNEYKTLPEQKLKELSLSKIQLSEEVLTPWLSFTGDTQIEFLDLSPEVKKSKYLIMEVTYIDEKRSVAQAREWGHIHLEEFLKRVHEFENEKIILSHQSRRHQLNELDLILTKTLDAKTREKILILPRWENYLK